METHVWKLAFHKLAAYQGESRVQAGCQSVTLTEGLQHVKGAKTHPSQKYSLYVKKKNDEIHQRMLVFLYFYTHII